MFRCIFGGRSMRMRTVHVVVDKGTFVTSPMINGTTTGVLREHAIPMDADVACVMKSNFPETRFSIYISAY
ncbi:uncharacterized protein BDV17DRAFT_275767 [Aspergillus undulatus]|uniref:uncharacterized protein n=1 Tax=Aspergillus undulatus TaxID=1810928 RepID=UPI003CCCB4B5